VAQAVVPLRADVGERLHAHADAVDLRVGGEAADQHRNVVGPAAAVGHVGEQEGLAVGLRDAAAELPAHQRMHLRVFIDRRVDGGQQAGLVQRGDMLLQIVVGPLPGPGLRDGFRGVVHRCSLRSSPAA
jgi:hypothetical protein